MNVIDVLTYSRISITHILAPETLTPLSIQRRTYSDDIVKVREKYNLNISDGPTYVVTNDSRGGILSEADAAQAAVRVEQRKKWCSYSLYGSLRMCSMKARWKHVLDLSR